jgi:hypothetical protein
MNHEVYRRGMADYWAGRCLVYRNLSGELVWNVVAGSMSEEGETYADSYIAGYTAASSKAEQDSIAMTNERNKTIIYYVFVLHGEEAVRVSEDNDDPIECCYYGSRIDCIAHATELAHKYGYVMWGDSI